MSVIHVTHVDNGVVEMNIKNLLTTKYGYYFMASITSGEMEPGFRKNDATFCYCFTQVRTTLLIRIPAFLVF